MVACSAHALLVPRAQYQITPMGNQNNNCAVSPHYLDSMDPALGYTARGSRFETYV